MAFDIQGALKEGYSLPEIVDYLGSQKKFNVEGARQEGYSDQEILDFLSPKKKEEGIGTALRRGAEQLVSTGQTALESVTKGGEEAAIRGQERQADIQARLGEGASLERLLETYRQQGLLAAGKELAGQIPTAIAEQLPNIGATLAGAGAGAMVAGPVGAVAGAVLPSLVQQYGGNIQRQAAEQVAAGKPVDVDLGAAGAAAVPQAALDVAATFIPLGGKLVSKFFGPDVGQLLMKSTAEGREKIAKEALGTTLAKGTAVGIAAEVPTEVVQSMLERTQAGLDVLSDDALKEYGEVAFATSLLGPIGIIGRVANKAEAGRQLAEAQRIAAETGEPQPLTLQLTYDPNVPTTRGEDTFVVFPDGNVATSEEAAFQQRYGMFKPPVTGEGVQTEATTTPEADQRAIQERMVEGFRARPEIQKIQQAYEQAVAKQDQEAIAKSAFNTVITPTVIKNFGVGPTASIFKDPAILNADISDPAVADQVREKLIEFGQKTKSQAVKDNIRSFLDRQEFMTPARVEKLLNPPQAVNMRAEGKQQFAFLDNEGNTVTKFGDIVKRGNKQIIKYEKGGERELTENVFVNPTPDDIVLLEMYGKRDRLDKRPDEFKQWISKYGIKPNERADLGIEKRIPNRLFRDDGYALDDLLLIAKEQNIITDADLDYDASPGGIESFREFIRRSVDGEMVPTPKNIETMLERESVDYYIQQLEEAKKGVPEEVVAEEAQATPEAIDMAEATALGKAEVKTPYTDKFVQQEQALFADLRKQLDQMGLQNVGLKLEDAVYNMVNGQMTEVNANYYNKLIQVSLAGDNMVRSLNHEAIHALRDLGFFSDKDWNTLSDLARKKWMDQYNIAKSYTDLDQDAQIEEAVAKAFGDRQSQPAPVRSIMTKVLDFLKRIGNFLRGNGFQTAEDVFGKAERGELKPTKAPTAEPKAEIPTREKIRAPLTGVDPKYAEKLLKQFTAEKATVKQRFEGLKDNFFERMVTGLFDEFRAIKNYSDDAYMMARMSKSTDGGLQGLLEHGEVFNDGGALNIRPGTKGLLKILEPLGTEVDQYQMWKALSRDANLPKEKRSFDPELLAGRDQLVKGELNGKSRKEIYEKALKEEQALNRSVLKVALDAGIIDQEGYNRFASDIYYIPFYKAMEDGDIQSISASSKLTGQEFSKALKGGEKKVNDLMENVLMNWSHILSASMKNQAALKTIDSAIEMGAARIAKPIDGKYPPNSVKVMRDGKPVRYQIEDTGLVDAISTISYLGPKSMFLDVAREFTNALRYGVTLSPAYKLRNLIRDSVSSAAVSPLSKNLYQNVYNGLRMSDKGNPTYMAALASGGIFEMGVAHEGNQAKLIKRLVDKGVDYGTILDTPDKIKGKLQAALDWYNQQGNRFENANRLALYDKLRKEGKTHLEAAFQARDLMDFSMQGQFRAVKVISTVVPFFNARLQGLYKLGRDGISPTSRLIYNTVTGKPVEASDKVKAQRFMTISGAVMLASMLLYGLYKDDEDFRRREDWDRDNFWWFKIGDTAFRIPKPFEIGALGTMAERTYEQISDDSVEGKVFFNRLNSILMDTFSLNPIPQMIKPMIDLYSNKDSFTGAPIESAGMERLSAQERVTDRTSGVAKALGGISAGMHKVLTFNPDAQGFSPIQVDYAIKAYLGWAGSTAAATADLAVEPFTEGTKVRKPVIDTLAMGFIKTEPETASKFMSQFYETNARVQSALADMRHYAELGDSEKVGKILKEQGDDIALAKLYDKTTKQLAEIRKQMRIIEQSKDIDPEDKRAEMNRLRILMSKIAENVEQTRKSMKP